MQFPKRSPGLSIGKAGGCFLQSVRGSARGRGGASCSPGLRVLRSTALLAPPVETQAARVLPPSAPLPLLLTPHTTPPQAGHQCVQTQAEASRAIWCQPQSNATSQFGSIPLQLLPLPPARWLRLAACGASGERQARTRPTLHPETRPPVAPAPRAPHEREPYGAASHPEARTGGHQQRARQYRAIRWQVLRLGLRGRPLNQPLLGVLRPVGRDTQGLGESWSHVPRRNTCLAPGEKERRRTRMCWQNEPSPTTIPLMSREKLEH